MVLGEGEDHLAAVQHRRRVLRGAGGLAVAGLGGAGTVEVADDHGYVAEALVGEARGERHQRRPGGFDERRAQREVLDRVAGEDHLGEGHEVRAPLGRLTGPVDDGVGVAVEVADGGVDLVQGES